MSDVRSYQDKLAKMSIEQLCKESAILACNDSPAWMQDQLYGQATALDRRRMEYTKAKGVLIPVGMTFKGCLVEHIVMRIAFSKDACITMRLVGTFIKMEFSQPIQLSKEDFGDSYNSIEVISYDD